MSKRQGLIPRSGRSFINPPNPSNSQPSGDTASNNYSVRITSGDTTSTSRNNGAELALNQRADPTPNPTDTIQGFPIS